MALNSRILILALAVAVALLVSVEASRPVSDPAPIDASTKEGREALIQAYLKQAISHAEISLDTFRRIKADPLQGSCNSVCEPNYEKVLSKLKESKDYAYYGDFSSPKDAMGEIGIIIGTCRDCFGEHAHAGIVKNPVQYYERELILITGATKDLLDAALNPASSPKNVSTKEGREALIQAYLKQAISNAETALDTFRNRVKPDSREGYCKSICEPVYDKVLFKLKESKDAANNGDFSSPTNAMGEIQGILSNCDSCFGELAHSGIVKNPVQGYQDELNLITAEAKELLQIRS